MSNQILYVTFCSADKRPGVWGPDEMYLSRRIARFVRTMETQGKLWAIHSARYGLFVPGERKPSYDTTYKTRNGFWLRVAVVEKGLHLNRAESEHYLREQIGLLRDQHQSLGRPKLAFYTLAAVRARSYLAVLHTALDGCPRDHGVNDLVEHLTACGSMGLFRRLSKVGSDFRNSPRSAMAARRPMTHHRQSRKLAKALQGAKTAARDSDVPGRTYPVHSRADLHLKQYAYAFGLVFAFFGVVIAWAGALLVGIPLLLVGLWLVKSGIGDNPDRGISEGEMLATES